jgi:hypothetical protein
MSCKKGKQTNAQEPAQMALWLSKRSTKVKEKRGCCSRNLVKKRRRQNHRQSEQLGTGRAHQETQAKKRKHSQA